MENASSPPGTCSAPSHRSCEPNLPGHQSISRSLLPRARAPPPAPRARASPLRGPPRGEPHFCRQDTECEPASECSRPHSHTNPQGEECRKERRNEREEESGERKVMKGRRGGRKGRGKRSQEGPKRRGGLAGAALDAPTSPLRAPPGRRRGGPGSHLPDRSSTARYSPVASAGTRARSPSLCAMRPRARQRSRHCGRGARSSGASGLCGPNPPRVRLPALRPWGAEAPRGRARSQGEGRSTPPGSRQDG